MPEIKVIETRDGSSSLLIPEMNETYHSTHGAMTESEYVFLKMGLDYFLKEHPNQKETRILEIGFGTGLNAWLTALASDAMNQKISYASVEKLPLDQQVIDQLNYKNKKDHKTAKELFEKLHQCAWDKEVTINHLFSLTKLNTDIFDYKISGQAFDLVYFDAFAPSRQPEMWSLEVLKKMYNVLNKDGVFVTYCAQGQFKRDLKEAGFEVESLDGPPGKKEMTRGLKKS